jgi:hypothetical protein
MVATSALPCSYSKAWSPSDDANLYAWYNQTGLGDTGADQTTWADQSGNNRDLSESGSANPTISSTTLNGLKGILFGLNSGMTRSSFLDLDGQDLLIAVLFKDDSGGNENDAVILDFDSPTTGYGLFHTNVFGFIRDHKTGKDSGSSEITSGNGFTELFGSNGATRGCVLVLHRSGDTVTTTVNGIELTSFTESVTSTGNDPLYLGSYSGISNESTSTTNFDTFLMVGDSITDGTRKAVEGYLSHKFGLNDRLKSPNNTDTHKYRKAKPWGVGKS